MRKISLNLAILLQVVCCTTLEVGATNNQASIAEADVRTAPLSAHEMSMLPGHWTGTVHLSQEYFSTCHHMTYDLDFNLSLYIAAGPSDNNPSTVQGTVHVKNPVIERIPCRLDPDTYSEWTIQYDPLDYQITPIEVRWKQGSPYMDVSDWRPMNVGTYDYKEYSHRGALQDRRRSPYQDHNWPALLPLSDISPTQFRVHADTLNLDSILLKGQPIDLVYATRVGDVATPFVSETLLKAHLILDGSFNRTDGRKSRGPLPRAGWLAALLAYLGLTLAAAIMNPNASKFLAGFGGFVGLAEALGGIGFKTIAAQGRSGGFIGAAMAEGIELARTYRNSTAARESGSIMAVRLWISFSVDVASFIAGAEIMGAAVGVAAPATGAIGVMGAVAVSVGGAALLTYGVGNVGDAVKDWANEKLSALIAK